MGSQLSTSLKANPYQDIKGRLCFYTRCLNDTFPLRKCSVKVKRLWYLCLNWDLSSKKLLIGPILMYYFPDHLVPERKCAASRFLSAFCRTVVDAINIITAANNDIIQFVSKFILFVAIYKIVKKLYDSLFNMLCAYI